MWYRLQTKYSHMDSLNIRRKLRHKSQTCASIIMEPAQSWIFSHVDKLRRNSQICASTVMEPALLWIF